MTTKYEYTRQAEFRSWANYLKELPPNRNSSILDLGCGLGTTTKLLASKYSHVTGIDCNTTFVNNAVKDEQAANIRFIKADLRKINDLKLPKADGIWCSFTAAYFPDFNEVLPNWIRFLNTGGWISLVEVNDLFNHSPLSKDTHDVFADHYRKLFAGNQYDFMMGSKLKYYAEKYHLRIIKNLEMSDPEFTFSGAANESVVAAWQDRLRRMTGFRKSLGEKGFDKVEHEFLDCIRRDDHISFAKINFLIAELSS